MSTKSPRPPTRDAGRDRRAPRLSFRKPGAIHSVECGAGLRDQVAQVDQVEAPIAEAAELDARPDRRGQAKLHCRFRKP